MAGTRVTVLVVHAGADPVVERTVEQIDRLCAAGLLRETWVLDHSRSQGRSLACQRIGRDGSVEVPRLLVDLAGRADVEVAHVVSVASQVMGRDGLDELATTAATVVDQIRRHRPPGCRVVEARIVAPTSLDEATPLVRLFSPEADANIVLVPEDRPDDESFALPLGLDDPDRYAGHVAVGVATQVGLWRGMDSAPIEAGAPGVTGIGDPKVVVARGLVRLAVGPPLPIDEAITSMDPVPVVPGCVASRRPVVDARLWADAVFDGASDLHFVEPAPITDDRQQLSVMAAARRLARETGRYLAGLPRQLWATAFADLEHLAGESVEAAAGEHSRLLVTWAGKEAGGVAESAEPSPEDLEREIAAKRAAIDTSSVRRATWSRVVDVTLAAVDGGHTPEGPPVTDEGHTVTITELHAFGPDPSAGADTLVDLLTSGDSDDSLLAHIGSRMRMERTEAQQALSEARAAYADAVAARRATKEHVLARLNWTMGVLIVALGVVATLAAGVPGAVGMLHWSGITRALVGIAVAVLAVGAASVATRVARRHVDAGRIRRRVGLTLGWTTFAALFVREMGIVRGEYSYLVWWSEILLVVAVAVSLVVLAADCSAIPSRTGTVAGRVTGGVALVYVGLSTVWGIARPGGWYSALGAEPRLRGGAWLAAPVAAGIVVVLLAIATIRVQERLRLADTAKRLHWARVAALDCATQDAQLGAAQQQYAVTAAALSRLVWMPFGPPVQTVDERFVDLEEVSPTLSLRVRRFDLSERARSGLIARIRREVVQTAWLQGQYEAAVRLFRTALAYRTGRDPESVAHTRPEHDQDVAWFDENGRTGSMRAHFTDLLYGSEFDEELRAQRGPNVNSEILNLYFESRDSLSPHDNSVATVQSFGAAILAGTTPSLPASLFARIGLPTAQDPRAEFTSDVWWPTDVIPVPGGLRPAQVHDAQLVDAGDAGMIATFVRSDWSIPFAASALPLTASVGVREEARVVAPAGSL